MCIRLRYVERNVDMRPADPDRAVPPTPSGTRLSTPAASGHSPSLVIHACILGNKWSMIRMITLCLRYIRHEGDVKILYSESGRKYNYVSKCIIEGLITVSLSA